MAQTIQRFFNTTPDALRFTAIGIGLMLLQWLVLGRLQIFGAFPDVLILFVSWVALAWRYLWGVLKFHDERADRTNKWKD